MFRAERSFRREITQQGQGPSRRVFIGGAAATLFLEYARARSPLSPSLVSQREIEPNVYPAITVHDSKFYFRGKPIGFIGENWYSLGEGYSTYNNQICGPILSTDQRFGWINDVKSLGMNVIRYWDFPELTANGRNTATMDQVVRKAGEKGIFAYPSFENHFADCDGLPPERKPLSWYKEGYKKTYLPFVKEMARKYKGDTRIFAFQLMNEAQCVDHVVLKEFAYTVLKAVKEIDPHRLVTPGLLGVNQPGTAGHELVDLFTPPRGKPGEPVYKFDFVDVHDWDGSETGSTNGLPGDPVNGIYRRLEEAKALGLPFLISEIGQRNSNGLTVQQAADRVGVQLQRLLKYPNFAGAIGWSFTPPGVTGDGMQYYSFGPWTRMFRSFAGRIKTH